MKRIMLLISMFSIIGNVSSFARTLNYDYLNGTGFAVNAKGGARLKR